VSLFSDLVGAYKGQGWTQQEAINIASVQIKGEGAGLGTGGADVASGGSNGISQWSAERWQNLKDWNSGPNGPGGDIRSVAVQTGFTTYELRNKYSYVDPNSIPDLVNNYESPLQSNRPGEISRSQAFAAANGGTQGTDAGPPGPLKGMGFGGASTDENSLNPTPSGQQKDTMKTPATATDKDLFNGAPIYLTDPHGVASEAGKSVQEGTQKAGADVKSGLGETAKSINDASAQAGGITQYFGNLFYNLLPRLGIITMGIILVGGAFVIMGFENARKTA